MAESLAFDLKLVDSVTVNAKRAADSLRVVENNAKKAQNALDFSKERGRASFNLQKIGADPKGYVALIKAQKELREQRNKLLEDAGIKKPESFAQGLMSRFSFAKIAGAAAVGELVAEGAFKVAESLVEGAKMAVETITDGVKDAFRAAGREETLRISEKNTLGAGGAREFREDAARFAKLTPFNDTEIRQQMLALRRAGLSQSASRQALATATDIGGGDKGAVGGILDQFRHIYTKRGVGKKQLQELLGNVGTTIPDFYKELGKKLHISAKSAETKAEQGGLDPQMLINMITQAQNKRQGGMAGTGGLEYAKSFEARWKKISELPDEFYKHLVDSPGFARASEALGGLLDKLDPDGPTGRRIQAAIGDMFDKITSYIGDPEETAQGLTDGIESAIGLTKDLISTAKDLADAFLPSLQTIEDMTFALRLAIATTKGDNATAAVNNEYANVVEQRGLRKLNKFQNENAKKAAVESYETTGFNPLLLAANAPTPAKAGRGKSVTVNVQPGAVTVHAAPGEDATHTHQKAGQEVHRHVVNAIERAAAESGG